MVVNTVILTKDAIQDLTDFCSTLTEKGPKMELKDDEILVKGVVAHRAPIGTREDILQEAITITKGQRADQYGKAEDSFKMVADLWSTYMGTQFQTHDVAILMALLKVARIKTGPSKRDSWVDLAGYAACGAETVYPERVSGEAGV